jgi:hypothetical protein
VRVGPILDQKAIVCVISSNKLACSHQSQVGISGLVVKSIVAIDGPRVRFAANATSLFYFFWLLLATPITVFCTPYRVQSKILLKSHQAAGFFFFFFFSFAHPAVGTAYLDRCLTLLEGQRPR